MQPKKSIGKRTLIAFFKIDAVTNAGSHLLNCIISGLAFLELR